jgi:hypothetical protein
MEEEFSHQHEDGAGFGIAAANGQDDAAALSPGQRIAKARKSIQELHKETLNQVSISSTITCQDQESSNDVARDTDDENQGNAANISTATTASMRPMTNLKPGNIPKKVSLELSMALFGNLNTTREGEDYVKQKMSDIEAELDEIRRSVQQKKDKEAAMEADIRNRMENDFEETEQSYKCKMNHHPADCDCGANENREYWNNVVAKFPDSHNPTATIHDVELLQLQCLFLKLMQEAVTTLDATFHRATPAAVSARSVNHPNKKAIMSWSVQAKAINAASKNHDEATACYKKQHECHRVVKEREDKEPEEVKQKKNQPHPNLNFPPTTSPERRSIWIMLCNNNAMLTTLEERLERHASTVESACTSTLQSMFEIRDQSISVHLGTTNQDAGIQTVQDVWQALLLLGKHGRSSPTALPPPPNYYTCNYVADNVLWGFCHQLYTKVLEPLISHRATNIQEWPSFTTQPPFESIFRPIKVEQSTANDGKTVTMEWQMVQDDDHDELVIAMERAKRKDKSNHNRSLVKSKKDLSMIEEQDASLDSTQLTAGSAAGATVTENSAALSLESQRWQSVLEAIQAIFQFVHQFVFVDIDDFPLPSEVDITHVDEITSQPPTHRSILAHKSGNHFFYPSVALHSDQNKDLLTPSYKGELSMTDLLHFHFNHHCLPLLPKNAAKSHDTFVDTTCDLERFLVESCFLVAKSSGDDSVLPRKGWLLKEHVQDFVQRYSERRQHEVLLHARYLVTNGDFHTTRFVGEDDISLRDPVDGIKTTMTQEERDLERIKAVFKFPKCAVSVVAFQLLELVMSTMEQACSPIVDEVNNSNIDNQDTEMDESEGKIEAENEDSVDNASEDASTNTSKTKEQKSLSSKLADASSLSLYRGARESLDLYRAIIPSIHQKELCSLPRMAAICHNDCVFLAHKSTTLGIAYQDRLLCRDMAPFVSFMDMIPLFRDMGDGVMTDMIKRECREIESIVSVRLGGFKDSLQLNEVSAPGNQFVNEYDAQTGLSQIVLFRLSIFLSG